MKTWKKVVSLLLAAALVIPGVDFGTLLQVNAADPQKSNLEVVLVSPGTGEMSMNVGETKQITAKATWTVSPDVSDSEAEDVTPGQAGLTWECTVSPDVATVTPDSATGTVAVAAKEAGTATITVTAKYNGQTASKTVVVTITGSETPVDPVKPDPAEIIVSPGNGATLKVDETLQLSVTVKPDDANNKEVTYTSGNTAVATVSETGLVTAKKAGTAIITVASTTKPTVKATCTITVEDDSKYTVLVSPGNADLFLPGTETCQLSAIVSPGNADATVTWDSSNKTVATVDQNGLVTALAEGETNITASVTIDGKEIVSEPCKVRVSDATKLLNVIIRSENSDGRDDKITLPNMGIDEFGREEVGIGMSVRLFSMPYPGTAEYDPDDTGWSTDNPAVATVSQNGTVRGISEGWTYIRAYIGGVSSAFRIDVKSSITHIADIDITGPTSVGVGQNKTLFAKVIGDENNDAKTLWTTDDPSIATVESGENGEGVVKGIKVGTTYIRARATCEVHHLSISSSVKIEVKENEVPDIAGVTITGNTTGTVYYKEPVTLGAAVTVSPSNATISKSVTWESTNEDYVTVSTGGVVTVTEAGAKAARAAALGEGDKDITVTIRAISKADTSKVGEKTITIGLRPLENFTIVSKSNEYEMMVGQTLDLDITVSPDNAVVLDEEITWSTDDPSKAVIDSNGVVMGLSRGTVTIRAAVGSISSSVRIKVNSFAPDIKNIIITGSTAVAMGKTITLQAVVDLDENASEETRKEVIWTTNDPTVATVGENTYTEATGLNTCVVTPVSPGKVVIRARSYPGSHGWTVSSAYEIEVTEDNIVKVTGVEITDVPAGNIVKVGTPVTLGAKVLPETATYKSVTWTSDNDEYATVDENGVVTALEAGVGQTVKITATSVGNTAISDEVELTIHAADAQKVTKITVAATATSVKVGDTVKVIAAVEPNDAADQAVTWSASNGNATVDENGNVTAKAEGTVDIKATAKDGSGVTGSVTITITDDNPPEVTVDSVTVTGTANVNAGNAVTLKATVKMSDGTTNKDVTWKSSNKKYATVNASGKVTTLKAGAGKTVTITATAKADGKTTGTIKINIKKVAVKKIAFNKAPKTVKIGKSVTLKVKFTPAKPTNTNVTWSLDKASKRIATLKNGKLTVKKTAKKGQKIKVTVTSKDNKKAKKTITIKVAK